MVPPPRLRLLLQTPGIAWVIAAAVKLGGILGLNDDGSGAALMPVIRMPAILFGILTGLLSFALARRMFRDDRVALLLILLSAAIPMFAVGSLLITIDSPMYLCWAATVYCLWRAVEAAQSKIENGGGQKSKITWLYAAGFSAAAGMLFKPVLIAIPIFALIAALKDTTIRRAFKTKHSWGALLVMMLSQVPVIIWNSQHQWVTFRHILTQGGLGKTAGDTIARSALQKFLLDPTIRIGSYLGGQAGGMGGLIFLLLVLAVILAMRQVRAARKTPTESQTPEAQWDAARLTFLLSFFVPLWAFYFVLNFWKDTELNWPAASYFTGMILLAAVVTRQWHSTTPKIRRDWARLDDRQHPLGRPPHHHRPQSPPLLPPRPRKTRPPRRHRSLRQNHSGTPANGTSPPVSSAPCKPYADAVQTFCDAWKLTPPGFNEDLTGDPLLITGRYDTSSSLSFYLPGHPFVYCLMSNLGGRQSQYDLWPGLNQRMPPVTWHSPAAPH